MNLEVRIGNRIRTVEVRRVGRVYRVRVDGEEYRVDAVRPQGPFYSFLIGSESFEPGVYSEGNRYTVEMAGRRFRFDVLEPGVAGEDDEAGLGGGPRQVRAVMPGRVVEVLVREGDRVEAGQGLVVLEAMKMENEVQSPRAGTVSSLHVSAGQSLEGGAPIATID